MMMKPEGGEREEATNETKRKHQNKRSAIGGHWRWTLQKVTLSLCAYGEGRARDLTHTYISPCLAL